MLRKWFQPREPEIEVQIDFHLDMLARQFQNELGLPPVAAMRVP